MLNPSSSAGKDIATSDQVGAFVSEDPQPQLVESFEFELKGPSDSKEEVVDEEDDLATPLEPLTKEFIHQAFPAPDILDINTDEFDTEAAIKKYNYTFDDSAEVPKRRALLVGIKGDALKGSHNDVDDMRALLMDVYHWKADEIMMLKDDDPRSPFYPVRQTVVDHLFILVHNARDGDRLFIQFSGHGSQIEDDDGDETDGLDEVICCADGEIIVDDQLHDILVKPLPYGCRLTALFDCCASGTGLDLVRTPGGTPGGSPLLHVQEIRGAQFNAGFAGGILDLPHGTQPNAGFGAGVMDLEHSYDENENNLGIDGIANVRPGSTVGRKKPSEGDVVMWSACLDNADSHEVVTDDGRYKGAMSHAFQECLRRLPEQSYRSLRQAIISTFAKWQVPQQPQLTSSQKLDHDDLFRI